MEIKIYNEFNDEVKSYWEDLEIITESTPFQSYLWLESWQTIIGAPIYKNQIVIICVFLEDHLEAILPLCIRKEGFVRVLEWLGGPNTDYMMPLIKKDSIFLQSNFLNFWEDIKSKVPSYDVLNLTKQPAKIGLNQNPFVYYLDNNFIMNSYQSFLNSGWQEYKEEFISKKVLSDSRRQRKRLSELGKLHFKVFSDEEDISSFIETMLKQKKRRYEEKEGWDMFQINEFRDFYINLPKKLTRDSSVHYSALLLDNKLIACHWGLINKHTLYYIMPTHEGGEFAKYSAGKLLLEELLEWCSLNGIQYLDFTGGDEPYKKIWTNQSEELFEVLESNSLMGNFYLYFNNLKSALKRSPIIGVYLTNFYRLIKRKN
tara:strand:+ start:40082 stop:41197 length:1116 start_codon:yes stop_codon:yes gene_type:complete